MIEESTIQSKDFLRKVRLTFSHGVGLIAAKHLANCWTAFEKNSLSSATILQPTDRLAAQATLAAGSSDSLEFWNSFAINARQ